MPARLSPAHHQDFDLFFLDLGHIGTRMRLPNLLRYQASLEKDESRFEFP